MGYSGIQGTLIYEKNLKAKISCQTPVTVSVGERIPELWLERVLATQ
jgi:hypothetical protein